MVFSWAHAAGTCRNTLSDIIITEITRTLEALATSVNKFYDHKNNVVEISSISVRVFGTRVRGFMVDYHLKLTIYNEIRDSESITLKKSTLCILSTEQLILCGKIGLIGPKISNFLDSLERELLCP